MKIDILGYPWTITVLPKKQFKKKFRKCKAIALLDKCEIYVREDVFNKLYVTHELTHAFIFYTCKQEVILDDHSWEEFIADLFGIHGETIVQLSKKILKEYK